MGEDRMPVEPDGMTELRCHATWVQFPNWAANVLDYIQDIRTFAQGAAASYATEVRWRLEEVRARESAESRALAAEAALNAAHAAGRAQGREEAAMVCDQNAACARVMIAKNIANNDRITAVALNRELNAHTRDARLIRALPSNAPEEAK